MQLYNENYNVDTNVGVCGIWRVAGLGKHGWSFGDSWDTFDEFVSDFVNAIYKYADESFNDANFTYAEIKSVMDEVFEDNTDCIEFVCRSDQDGFKHLEKMADILEMTYHDIRRSGYYLRMYFTTCGEVKKKLNQLLKE